MAATYMVHIAKNHAFVDANKRTALLATLVFLGLNGHDIGRDDRRLDDAVLAVATGGMSREEVARLLMEIVQVS